MPDDAERGRVEAEDGRVQAEEDRVTAEGQKEGAVDARRFAEAGRVTAEHGRVEAEELRGASWVLRYRGSLLGVLMAAVIGLVLLCGYLVGEGRNQNDRIKESVASAQLEQLRNCVRANINSAIIKLSVARPGATPAERKIAAKLYPILDCKQTQVTRTAVPLTGGQDEKYVALVAAGRAPVVNDGKVIGSRASVLEGIKSIEQAGTK